MFSLKSTSDTGIETACNFGNYNSNYNPKRSTMTKNRHAGCPLWSPTSGNCKLSVKFLHNDANCMEMVHYLPDMGVNLFNMGYDTDLNELKDLTRHQVTMLGNIPPRDVLAQGSPAEVKEATLNLLQGLKDPSRVIFSCGGGMPPGVSSENLAIFIETVKCFTL